ncbi:MAG: hypothetical protein KAT04_05110 [Methylococcales bacterium]|nr:hypothetical protein [Methylococcales bacterium]
MPKELEKKLISPIMNEREIVFIMMVKQKSLANKLQQQYYQHLNNCKNEKHIFIFQCITFTNQG